MGSLVSWLRERVEKVVDPEKSDRIREIKLRLHQAISEQKQSFNLREFASSHVAQPGDLEAARHELYREILARGWKDGSLSRREQSTAVWVANALAISLDQAQACNFKLGLEVFERALAKAMEDGHVEQNEAEHLAEIAHSIGTDLPTLVQRYFVEQGEDFVRAAFLTAVENGSLSTDEWETLLRTTTRLGLTQQQLLAAIAPHAQQYVSHVLADARADGILATDEERLLEWLLTHLSLAPTFVSNVQSQIAELRLFTDVAQGRLPAIAAPANVELKAGEICHFSAQAQYSFIKQLKSGPRVESHHGTVALTDNRLIFISHTTSFSLKFRRVVSHSYSREGVALLCETKRGSGSYSFYPDARLAYAILVTAVRRANQTIVDSTDAAPSRHIPRDVRQRVWQRYGGRCAECTAADYLEFDHIIPVARGGSNGDANVQLLCRRCNLKKSDAI